MPIEVGVEIVVDAPRDQLRFGVWLRVVANEPVGIIGVHPAIEADIRHEVTRATDHRKLLSEVTTTLVVIDGVGKTVLLSVAHFSFFGKEELVTTVRSQRLPAKRRLLVETEATVEAAELVVLVDEAIVSRQKSDERIRLADVALQTQDADRSILVDKSLNAGKDTWIRAIVFAEISRRIV